MGQKADVIIAVDIGTTSTKVLAVDRSGTVRHAQSEGYPLVAPKPGHAEQDPDAIFEAVVSCMERTVKGGGYAPGDILAVAFSSASHSLILLDEADRPLTPSITWADVRSAPQAERLRQDGSGLALYKRTGTPIHPMTPLCKMLWFREEAPEVWRKAKRFIGIKEYVLLRLFGEAVTDLSMAGGTGLFNLHALDYDEDALALAGIGREHLPRLAKTTDWLSGLSRDMALRLGLSPDTPFVLGAQDGVLANLGVGAMEDGIYAVTIGTSSAVRTAVRKPVLDPQGRLFCYALTPDDWIVGGPSNNGAVAVNWMAERLCPGRSLDDVLPWAEQVPPGADGLLFAPFLAGERAPHWDPRAKGVLLGLTLAHRNEHLLRAAMEGVLFQVAAIAAQIRETGRPIREVRASGGFARSALWCQMLADVLDTPVIVPPSVESSALGAAKLALFALEGSGEPPWRRGSDSFGRRNVAGSAPMETNGDSPGQGNVAGSAPMETNGGSSGQRNAAKSESTHVTANRRGRMHAEARTHVPDPGNAAAYRELLPIYTQLYTSMKDAMRALDAWSANVSAAAGRGNGRGNAP